MAITKSRSACSRVRPGRWPDLASKVVAAQWAPNRRGGYPVCQDVAPHGQVTATDLETGFLSRLALPNLTVLRHDVRTDDFPLVRPGTALAEFYRLSIQALCQSLISAGLLTAAEAARLTARLAQPDFTGCGFAHIGAWGRRNHYSAHGAAHH